jgi:hypothetical protein
MTPKVDELPRLQTRHAAAMRFFANVKNKRDLDRCVLVLEPEDVRAEFDVAFRRFAQSMDMLLPDPRALEYVGDLTLARQDPRGRACALPRRQRRHQRLRRQGPEAHRRGHRGRRHRDPGEAGEPLLARLREPARRAQEPRGARERDGARHPQRDPRALDEDPAFYRRCASGSSRSSPTTRPAASTPPSSWSSSRTLATSCVGTPTRPRTRPDRDRFAIYGLLTERQAARGVAEARAAYGFSTRRRRSWPRSRGAARAPSDDRGLDAQGRRAARDAPGSSSASSAVPRSGSAEAPAVADEPGAGLLDRSLGPEHRGGQGRTGCFEGVRLRRSPMRPFTSSTITMVHGSGRRSGG